jgi:DNA-binding XRE family transcriptional regulator
MLTSKPDLSIGDRLKLLRREHGSTQEEPAERAGVSVDVIKKLERGAAAFCQPDYPDRTRRARSMCPVPSCSTSGPASTAPTRDWSRPA